MGILDVHRVVLGIHIVEYVEKPGIKFHVRVTVFR